MKNPMDNYGYSENEVELTPVKQQMIDKQSSIDQSQDNRISLLTTGAIFGYPIE